MGAELCFYFGFSHNEVQTLDGETALMYHKALRAIRANELRGQIEAATFPHLQNTKDRENVRRQIDQAVRLNVSDGDYARERELERILAERHGKRKS